MSPTQTLEFSILKIINRVARIGRDMKELFAMWDQDKNGYLDANEIIRGVSNVLGIAFSREEAHLLQQYLDKDGDGHVTYSEFSAKVNF